MRHLVECAPGLSRWGGGVGPAEELLSVAVEIGEHAVKVEVEGAKGGVIGHSGSWLALAV